MATARPEVAPLLQRLAAERLDRDRHVLNVLTASLRGDDDFLDPSRSGTGLTPGRLICSRKHTRMRSEDRRNGTRDLAIGLH